MTKRPPASSFSPAQLESICKALGDTSTGLTGSEIGHILGQLGIADPDPSITKWQRLYNALAARQNRDGKGDWVLAFIRAALDPARYPGRQSVFDQRRTAVNVPLAFYGLEYAADGTFRLRKHAATLAEAEERANRLRAALERRDVDPEVLRFCRAELVQQNCFHAVLDATKSVAAQLRDLSGPSTDGAALVAQTLGGDNPPVRINAHQTETERGEQRGFASLLVGMFGTFRNPAAHEPKIEWPISEQDALDLLSLASYVHRRLRAARPS